MSNHILRDLEFLDKDQFPLVLSLFDKVNYEVFKTYSKFSCQSHNRPDLRSNVLKYPYLTIKRFELPPSFFFSSMLSNPPDSRPNLLKRKGLISSGCAQIFIFSFLRHLSSSISSINSFDPHFTPSFPT